MRRDQPQHWMPRMRRRMTTMNARSFGLTSFVVVVVVSCAEPEPTSDALLRDKFELEQDLKKQRAQVLCDCDESLCRKLPWPSAAELCEFELISGLENRGLAQIGYSCRVEVAALMLECIRKETCESIREEGYFICSADEDFMVDYCDDIPRGYEDYVQPYKGACIKDDETENSSDEE